MMKRLVIALCATFVIGLATETAAHAQSWTYGGWQPWWNILNRKHRHRSPEEQRLQQFWRDYYDALRRYYGMMDNIDWVSYYKNHGYQINAGGGGYGPCRGPQRVQFAPVFVSPSLQWAVPNSTMHGPNAVTPAGYYHHTH